MVRDRRERDAKNQSLFREINERIEQLDATFELDGQETFVCECGNPKCVQAIALSRAEYECVRGHANRFAIALDHENPETETIVDQNDRFAVVESYAGKASEIARETDPRSQANTRAKREQADQQTPET